ncbi:cysteine hydrolase family protein [Halomonas sp. DWK9]|uniref:cysteine hydrolase family protein n=1 Tax=Halomonas sp. DWK9 TaxID=3060155 RepID=UPI00287FF185|nr:cysteine hydrolase family protein [Halomonas sp. DWK9]
MFATTNQRMALIIIDMQQGMATLEAGERNNPHAEANIKRLLATWRQSQQPVVHVSHLSRTPNSPFWPGQSGVLFQPELEPLATEHIVDKNVPDAFTHSGLEHWLHARGIHKLVVVGVSTSHSVEATVRSAGNLGFETYVVSDATFTFAKRDYAGTYRTAEEVHAMSLANLAGEYTEVVSTEEALEFVELGAGLPTTHRC